MSRIFKILRALKLKNIVTTILDNLDIPESLITILQLLKPIIIIVVSAHWITCFFCLVFFNDPKQVF